MKEKRQVSSVCSLVSDGGFQPPDHSQISHTPRKNPKMLYFIPDWDDMVDPKYDFVNDRNYSEKFDCKHEPRRDDYYAYQLMKQYVSDGILVSKIVVEMSKVKRSNIEKNGIHKFLRIPRNVPVMGDCGAFGYINEEVPPYNTSEIINYYQSLDFDFGVTIDHLIVPGVCSKTCYYQELKTGGYKSVDSQQFTKCKEDESSFRVTDRPAKQRSLIDKRLTVYSATEFDQNEAQRRWDITLKNGLEFIKLWSQGSYDFHPIAATQGWDVESYVEMFKAYQDAGFDYIALGSLVRSQTPQIIAILEGIDKIRKPGVRIHLFGIARLESVPDFLRLGVYSCDSASPLRQAWTSGNYWVDGKGSYSAIRVPPVTGQNQRIKKMIKEGRGTLEEFVVLEKETRNALWAYDAGKISLDEVLEKVLEYDQKVGDGRKSHAEKYRKVLEDKPWEQCPCPVCRQLGIEVIIFRGNNRNRRRGFHNTYCFFDEFKKLTG